MEQEWSYRLDPENRVVEVGPGWNEFADENESPGSRSERVLGRPIMEFVSGAQTRALVRVLLARVRESKAPVELPFRCDSPTLRRFMEWAGTAGSDGSVVIRTRLLGSGERGAVWPRVEAGTVGGGGELGELGAGSSLGLIRMCSWCNRIAAGPDVWLEPETAAGRLGLFLDTEVPEISHGICPPCQAGVMGELPVRQPA